MFILITHNTVCTMQAVYFYAHFARVMGAQRAPRLSAFGKPLFRQRFRLTAGLTLIFARVMEPVYILVSDTRLWEFESPHGYCTFDICPCDGCTACTTLVRLWKAFVQAEASIDGGLDFDICPCDGTGIHTWLRTKVLRVRISPRILRRIGATGRRSSFKNCPLRVRLPYPAVRARTALP